MTIQQVVSALEFDLADRMRRALRVSGVKVNEMAEYLGVGRNSISNWINGRIQPSRQTLRLWAIRTGVPLEWLETGLTGPTDGSGGPTDGETATPVRRERIELPTRWLSSAPGQRHLSSVPVAA